MNVLRAKDKEMRRLQKMIENALIDPREQYIETRITQLKDDMEKAHDEHDKNWYNRLIQELDWVQQMKTKPTHNCHMQRNYGIQKGMMKE
jgi:hypothetical protein